MVRLQAYANLISTLTLHCVYCILKASILAEVVYLAHYF